MIRLSRLTDYGIVLLSRMALQPDRVVSNARDLAEESHVPRPTVSKILKRLVREGLLESHRGVQGGYSLARPADEITGVDIIRALEGPITLTECNIEEPAPGECCTLEALCPTKVSWQRINDAVVGALQRITLAEMAQPFGMPLFAALGDRNQETGENP